MRGWLSVDAAIAILFGISNRADDSFIPTLRYPRNEGMLEGKNGFCTQIGNDWFTWFATRTSKSRLNFLDLLRAGHTDYVLNEAAYGYMRKHSLSAPLI